MKKSIDIIHNNCLELFDGWELNGKVFPGEDDHEMSLDQRSHVMCSGKQTRSRRFLSSQNAALISYKIPTPGQGFKIRVTYHPNPDSKVSWYGFLILMSLSSL